MAAQNARQAPPGTTGRVLVRFRESSRGAANDTSIRTSRRARHQTGVGETVNKALLDAIGEDQSVKVEHDGLEAILHPPVGEDAVDFVLDARKLEPRKGAEPDEGAMMKFIAKWIGRLLQPHGLDPTQSWRVFLAMGGFDGPVPQAMVEMVSACVGLPPSRVEAVPTSPDGTSESTPAG